MPTGSCILTWPSSHASKILSSDIPHKVGSLASSTSGAVLAHFWIFFIQRGLQIFTAWMYSLLTPGTFDGS